jgi:hypothetical protein
MRHALLVVFLALLCIVPLPVPVAHADSATFDPGPPKGVVGADGIACTGRATQDGHTLTYTVYIGADGDEMASRPDRERAWQADYCQWALSQDMSGWYRYQWNVQLDPTNIHVSTKHL